MDGVLRHVKGRISLHFSDFASLQGRVCLDLAVSQVAEAQEKASKIPEEDAAAMRERIEKAKERRKA